MKKDSQAGSEDVSDDRYIEVHVGEDSDADACATALAAATRSSGAADGRQRWEAAMDLRAVARSLASIESRLFPAATSPLHGTAAES